ncbi:MAG TPA: outer membrane lipoprotein-sorting protein [bacterium]|nr:outer membrane lipoprotein-sorting protein [bacterium]
MTRVSLPLSLLPLALLLSLPAAAADLSARDVAKKAADAGAPAALRQAITMTLTDAKGTKTTRAMTIVHKKVGTSGDAALWNTRIEFQAPKDVAGTVLLSLDKAKGGADQYLYLPGIKRVRRVGGSQKSGSFQGSDFAYEDLGSRELDSADYALLADEKIGADDCYQLQAIPRKRVDTGYGKMLLDVRKSDFLTLRARYFDAKGVELKTLTVDAATVKVQGETRIPQHLEMKTAKDGHATALDVTEIAIDPKIDDAIFDPASLDRG